MNEIRRIVTGHDANGKAVFSDIGRLPSVVQQATIPGTVFHEIWSTRQTPAPVGNGADRPDRPGVPPGQRAGRAGRAQLRTRARHQPARDAGAGRGNARDAGAAGVHVRQFHRRPGRPCRRRASTTPRPCRRNWATAPTSWPASCSWPTPCAVGGSMAALAAAVAEEYGVDAAALASLGDDPAIEGNFGAYPPLSTPRADGAGFRHEGDARSLVRRALE